MATNKHALIRYKALDYCFSNRNKRYYVKDLIEACNRAIAEYHCEEAERAEVDDVKKYFIKRRSTLYDDIEFMKERWDAPIVSHRDGQKVYMQYDDPDFSISKKPLSEEEIDSLKETLIILSRFKGMPQFEWMEELLSKLEVKFTNNHKGQKIIGFEENTEYSGSVHISALFHAIINKQPLRVHYRTYKGVDIYWNLHPYYLKQYNNRWFLLGLDDDYRTITTAPLERIVSFTPIDRNYIESKIDFDEYFDDIIGVSFAKGKDVIPVKIRFDKDRFPYIETKPLHWSQRVKDRDNGIVEIHIIPNREFFSLILSFGEQAEILEPQWLRDEIQIKINEASKLYGSCTQASDKQPITLHCQPK